mmetsp:Transcript_1405/g.3219  ORF Transcript_1405/g.3219 Transcript_1405/m.3219 type:complete len:394 (-) Transcript_1405:56-1237(-)
MAPSYEPPQDPWDLVRLAIGSLVGESWRVKQALREPAQAWTLRSPRFSWWEEYQKCQSFEDFKRAMPFRPNTANLIHIVIVGDDEQLLRLIHLESVLRHVEVFTGFRVLLRGGKDSPIPRMRLAASGQRTSVDGVPQIGAHFVLAFLQSFLDPRAACTLALTPVDIYPPEHYDYVTGMTDPQDRLGLYSTSRYFSAGNAEDYHRASIDGSDAGSGHRASVHSVPISPSQYSIGPLSPGSSSTAQARTKRLELSKLFAKLLSREVLKLCGIKECHLLHCLMNPLPQIDSEVTPEAVSLLPFSLCCACLRKLQWITQADLLDRYARLAPVTHAWFFEETQWLWERMVQVGMPTSVCLSIPEPTGSKFKFGLPKKSGRGLRPAMGADAIAEGNEAA